ncbi:iron-containing alcohol dehydrogenase [Cupriavidus basilensis]
MNGAPLRAWEDPGRMDRAPRCAGRHRWWSAQGRGAGGARGIVEKKRPLWLPRRQGAGGRRWWPIRLTGRCCCCVERGARSRGDLVVGLGGGSSMDIAKLAAVLAVSSSRCAEMYGIGNVKGAHRVPLVQMPTTAGERYRFGGCQYLHRVGRRGRPRWESSRAYSFAPTE